MTADETRSDVPPPEGTPGSGEGSGALWALREGAERRAAARAGVEFGGPADPGKSACTAVGGGGNDWNPRERMVIASAFATLALLAVMLLALLAVRAPVRTVDRYLLALRESRVEEAWDMLHATSEFKSENDLQGYVNRVREEGMEYITSWKAHLAHLTGSRAYVDVELFHDGEAERLRFGLRNEGKGWTIYEPGPE